MELSSNTRMDLYRAISEPIVDVRIQLKLSANLSAKDDFALAQIEHKIWQRVREVLKLPNTI